MKNMYWLYVLNMYALVGLTAIQHFIVQWCLYEEYVLIICIEYVCSSRIDSNSTFHSTVMFVWRICIDYMYWICMLCRMTAIQHFIVQWCLYEEYVLIICIEYVCSSRIDSNSTFHSTVMFVWRICIDYMYWICML